MVTGRAPAQLAAEFVTVDGQLQVEAMLAYDAVVATSNGHYAALQDADEALDAAAYAL